MQSKGGYILHMDGTCEGGSPHMFSCMDEISNIVLGNRKMPTEDSQYIIPLLQGLKASYGNPIALVHDMGGAILKAITTVFPGIPDFICHFHFLRDLGKDLFNLEYREVHRMIRSYNIRVKLAKALKQIKIIVTDDRTIQPQRTNNLLEQSFRFLKRDSRKKSGLHSLSKTLKGMLADTPLVKNLSNPGYMTILLKGKKDLASRFADIDIWQVRKREKENEKNWSKYPKRMSRLFKISHLPGKLVKLVA